MPKRKAWWRGPVTGDFETQLLRHKPIDRRLWATVPLYGRYWNSACVPALAWMTMPRARFGALFDGLLELRDEDDAQWVTVDWLQDSLGRVISLAGLERVGVRIRHRTEGRIVYERQIGVRADDMWLIRAHDGRLPGTYRNGKNWIESGWLSDYRFGGPILKRARASRCRDVTTLGPTGWVPQYPKR